MIETALNGARRPRKFCPVVVWCSPPCVCRTSCVSYVVCVARRVCRPSCVVVRRAFWVSSFVVTYVVCFLMYSPHFSRTSWASGSSFWSPFAFDLSYAPARLCTSAGVPRSTRAGRGFPLGVYISLAAWWSFGFARAVLVFLRVVHWGGPFPSSVRGASSLVHWGGPISCLTRTRSSERRFVCLLYNCCFVVSWLFDVRARSLRARPCVSGAFQSKIPAASFHRIPHRTAHTLNDRARRVAAWTETIVARRVAAHGNGSTCCVATWALVVMHFGLLVS